MQLNLRAENSLQDKVTGSRWKEKKIYVFCSGFGTNENFTRIIVSAWLANQNRFWALIVLNISALTT